MLLPVTLSALMLVSALPARAQSKESEEQRQTPRENAPKADRESRTQVRARRSSLSDAVRRVQRETGGQVLGAERVQFDGRDINRIKVMDDRGRVRYMDDDPQQRRAQDPPVAPPARGDNPSTP